MMSTYLRLSLCVLYSMTVFGGRLRTRFNVSRIREVVTVSQAVLFQSDKMSSYKITNIEIRDEAKFTIQRMFKRTGQNTSIALLNTWPGISVIIPYVCVKKLVS